MAAFLAGSPVMIKAAAKPTVVRRRSTVVKASAGNE
jgi:hypothetical protein